MASAVFFVGDPDLLPPPAARETARVWLQAAVADHWLATTTDQPHWVGPMPRCAQCGATILSHEARRCRNCDTPVDWSGFEGGKTRFDVSLSDDLDTADLERLRAGLSAALGAPVRAARKP
jgi:hypothetical protein